jgi:hypothetical protein
MDRPAERGEPRDIHELARRAVGLGGVPSDAALEADHLRDDLCELLDRHVRAGADIDKVGRIGHSQQEGAGVGQLVHMQELALRRTSAPGLDLVAAGLLRLVEATDERRQHVRVLQDDSCRPGRRGWSAWRSGRGRHAACDRPGPASDRRSWRSHRLHWSAPAHRSEDSLPASVAERISGRCRSCRGRAAVSPHGEGAVDGVARDSQVFVEKVSRIGVVRVNTADLGRGDDRDIGLFGGVEGVHRRPLRQVESLSPRTRDRSRPGFA